MNTIINNNNNIKKGAIITETKTVVISVVKCVKCERKVFKW